MTERLDGPVVPPADTADGPPTEPAETPRTQRRLGPSPAVAIAFLLPAAVLLGIWVVYPIVYSIFRSLFDSAGTGFVGLGNYATIFTDSSMLTTIRNNLIWVVVGPIVVQAAMSHQ